MRYVAKFVNGAWAVFDTHEYSNVAVHALGKLALEHADRLNRKA